MKIRLIFTPGYRLKGMALRVSLEESSDGSMEFRLGEIRLTEAEE